MLMSIMPRHRPVPSSLGLSCSQILLRKPVAVCSYQVAHVGGTERRGGGMYQMVHEATEIVCWTQGEIVAYEGRCRLTYEDGLDQQPLSAFVMSAGYIDDKCILRLLGPGEPHTAQTDRAAIVSVGHVPRPSPDGLPFASRPLTKAHDRAEGYNRAGPCSSVAPGFPREGPKGARGNGANWQSSFQRGQLGWGLVPRCPRDRPSPDLFPTLNLSQHERAVCRLPSSASSGSPTKLPCKTLTSQTD